MRTIFLVLVFTTSCGSETSSEASPLVTGATCQAPQAVPGPTARGAPTLEGAHVLWIGAHPDDETTAAPLLADWCTKASCTMLVLTRGEGGTCKLDGGCAPELATVRTKEMEASARLFGATLLQGTLPNASFNAADAWHNWVTAVGSENELIARVSALIQGLAIDTVVTFDPRHGTTCHGEHRAAGVLAIVAADRAGLPRSRVWMMGSRVQLVESSPGVPCFLGYSAAVNDPALYSLAPDVTGWNRSVDVLRAHASQFTVDEVRAAATAPNTLRSTWYLRASDAVDNDPRYANACP